MVRLGQTSTNSFIWEKEDMNIKDKCKQKTFICLEVFVSKDDVGTRKNI